MPLNRALPARLAFSRQPAPPRRPPHPRQPRLFCPCGLASPAIAGLCRPCYRRTASSRARFGGHRDRALDRDRATCCICGAPEQRTVHHRRPGDQTLDWLLTVCPSCHARIHHLAAIDRYVLPAMLPFWVELHPGAPVQLQFAFEADHV